MVENAPGRLCLALIIAQERRGRMGLAYAVTHALRQLTQLLCSPGELVRLQVKEDLEAVLGLAEEAVGVIENPVFLIGEAAGPFKGFQGEQCIALADGG